MGFQIADALDSDSSEGHLFPCPVPGHKVWHEYLRTEVNKGPENAPWVRKIPWKGNGNPLQCSCWEIPWTEELAGYSPWGLKDSDMTEHKHRVSIIP